MSISVYWNLEKPISKVDGVQLDKVAFTKPTLIIVNPMNPKTYEGYESFIYFDKKVTWRTVLKAYKKIKGPGVKAGDDHHFLERISPIKTKKYMLKYSKNESFYGSFYKAILLLSNHYDIYTASTGS